MADIGVYGALGGLGKEIRDMSKEATDRQWQVYQNSVNAQRAENLERIRHKYNLERDKASGERAATTATTAHQRAMEQETHRAKTRQQYPTAAEQAATTRATREAEECDQTFESGGNLWCQQGRHATLVTRGMNPEEKAEARGGHARALLGQQMGKQSMASREGKSRPAEKGRVPMEPPTKKPEGLKTADANAIHGMSAAIWGGKWDPETQRWMDLTKDDRPKAQAVSTLASRLFVDAGGVMTQQEAVSEALRRLFPDIPDYLSGQQSGMPGAGAQTQSNDPLGLGL